MKEDLSGTRVNILNKYWYIFFVPNLGGKEGYEYVGHCDHFDSSFKSVKIKRGQPIKEESDCLIHELLHVIFPQADEEFVDKAATDVNNILHKFYKIERKK